MKRGPERATNLEALSADDLLDGVGLLLAKRVELLWLGWQRWVARL